MDIVNSTLKFKHEKKLLINENLLTENGFAPLGGV